MCDIIVLLVFVLSNLPKHVSVSCNDDAPEFKNIIAMHSYLLEIRSIYSKYYN